MATTRLLTLFSIALLLLLFSSCKPLCPISSCQVRMVHRHGGEEEFRGMPFYKKQNPKIGESLPKQTGEVRKRTNDKSSRKN
ncbi:hypothetical protein H9Q13_02975 [Pontibacter sp. JH31]|uniref:Uncharacterized protein n=1 Tax=Pontibacter aquaedesilientis TaxID=2766980 RepID=A0ABR7XCU6_9BACT|nr:hypothetical protein [Pontibacter aquaedesilientis]MBD1396117.1 hypothetical protein [Pontibacter aquaedesilientis]